MSQGNIFDIKEFAVHDGPGIRKTVFLKGCPLNCMWCHNPEGISPKPEIMVSKAACIDCGRCKDVCQNNECIVCGRCVDACPLNLRRIAGTLYEARELANMLLKDKDFLESQGGGITISGGEPLMQSDFLLELLGLIKPMHRIIDTCGHAPTEVFKEALKCVEMVLFDVKHMDSAMHKKYTGQSLDLITPNLAYLCKSTVPFRIRIPLIPGVNDTNKNMEDTAKFIAGANNLIQVDLLPYHLTAGAKYTMIGKAYNPSFDEKRPVNIYVEIFQRYGIKVNVA